MYSLSDHYIFASRIDYNVAGEEIGHSITKYDITPIFILILILVFLGVLNEIVYKILQKVKRHIEIKKAKKKKNE